MIQDLKILPLVAPKHLLAIFLGYLFLKIIYQRGPAIMPNISLLIFILEAFRLTLFKRIRQK